MVPNCELDFGFEFGVDIGNFGSYEWIIRIESWLQDTDLEKNHGNLLKVSNLQCQDSLSRLNKVGGLHNLDKDVSPDLSDKVETFGQLHKLLPLTRQLI
jgi:hypothetical protein